jgi:hypothetical protein
MIVSPNAGNAIVFVNIKDVIIIIVSVYTIS